MHLAMIIAFAALMWFNQPTTEQNRTAMNLLHLSADWSLLAAVGQLLLVVLAASWLTQRILFVLRRHPDDPNRAQVQYHYNQLILNGLALAMFISLLILTSWPDVVRGWLGPGLWWGLPDLVIISPYILAVLLIWIMQYPADRSIRQLAHHPRLVTAQPVHPIWSWRQYLLFNVRFQMLTVAVPMILILVTNDAIDFYRRSLQMTTGLHWLPDLLTGGVVALIFLTSPVMMRYIWQTSTMPDDALRTRLEQVARRMGLRYRDILIWHSRGMVINAAVMGIWSPLRYILISDGLLETLSDRQIEAVFGHEAGHVRYGHIPLFVVFALLTMMLAGGVLLGLDFLHRQIPGWKWLSPDLIQIIVGGVVVLMWGWGFGWLSHLFEHQADYSGASSIETPDPIEPVTLDPNRSAVSGLTLQPQAAAEFAQALQRVALLNGIPVNEQGWRHPSINRRIEFLQQLTESPRILRAFERRIFTVQVSLIAATIIALAVAAWLYRDWLWPVGW
ncbi:MAG: Protease HtpX [Phycisphaerae bacterium]|nr:Protease HtpX [Phycisphaerae bacterium]